MRQLIAYQADARPDGLVVLSRCRKGVVDHLATKDWREAVTWLTGHDADPADTFHVCFSLHDFVNTVLPLLPEETSKAIKTPGARVFVGGNGELVDWSGWMLKSFYLPRLWGIKTRSAVIGNIVAEREIDRLFPLDAWLSEDEDEPSNVRELWDFGNRILRTLDGLYWHPTRLPSPAAVFADCYLGDARDYPTVFNWPEEKYEAVQFAEDVMRFEWRSAYQVGAFGSTHQYDLTGAYPAVIARLPSTVGCRCEHATEKLDWSTWGLVRGEVNITADVSPLVYEDADGNRINPKGQWFGTFTTREIDFLTRWKLGTFNLVEGWFFEFGSEMPYEKGMRWLYLQRGQAKDKRISYIFKKMAQGVSGKLDETHEANSKEPLGSYYNPILACMVRSETRLAVGEFIYQHGLVSDLVAVLVDSVLSTRPASNLLTTDGMGSWRCEGENPAIVLSKGNIWRPGKKPQGIGYNQLLDALASEPDKAYYEFRTARGSLRAIDLLLDGSNLDREFESYPENGGDVLSNVYSSVAISL